VLVCSSARRAGARSHPTPDSGRRNRNASSAPKDAGVDQILHIIKLSNAKVTAGRCNLLRICVREAESQILSGLGHKPSQQLTQLCL